MFQPGTGTVVFGRYRLRREIARGSMGSVWMAQDQKLHRAVAVKLMAQLLHDSTEARLRFEREAMAVAQLQSPHVVQIYDYGIESGCPFIVMELLEGEDLRARLKRRKRLELDETRAVLVQACKALGVAHAAGIIHRDLKPANLFLVESRDDEIVKVLDFGVAKADPHGDIEQETTKQGALLGTPQYMSPEQARAEKIDHRSDLWSLGVITFRMLTGQVPFQGKSLGDIIIGICTKPVPRATALDTDLPVDVDEFFERALARDPEKRFPTARDLAAAFSAIAPASYPSLSMPFSIGRPSAPVAIGSRPGAQRTATDSSDRMDLLSDDYFDGGETRVAVGRDRPAAVEPAGPKPVSTRVGMAAPPPPPRRGPGAPPSRKPEVGSRLPDVPLAPGVAQSIADPRGADSDGADTLDSHGQPEGGRAVLPRAAAALAAATAVPQAPPPAPSGAGLRVVGVKVAPDDDDAETRFMGDPRAAEELLAALPAPAPVDEESPVAALPTPLDAAYVGPAGDDLPQARARRWPWFAAAAVLCVVIVGVAIGVGGAGATDRAAAARDSAPAPRPQPAPTPPPASTAEPVATTASAPVPSAEPSAEPAASESPSAEPAASESPSATASAPATTVAPPPPVRTTTTAPVPPPPKVTATATATAKPPDPKPTSTNPFDDRL